MKGNAMWFRRLSVTLICLLAASTLFAQANTAPYHSSVVGGMNVANRDGAPYADQANPASSAGLERPTLDLSYHALVGTGDDQGYGQWLNLGASIPSNLGVFSASGHFATSPFQSLPWGTFVGIDASFAKDLYKDLYFGLGLGAQFGAPLAGAFDWGLGLDLGFLHLPGDLAFLNDFTWGISFRDVGKPFTTPMGSVPAAFTPAIGTSFGLIGHPRQKTGTDAAPKEDLVLSFSTDLSFPTFQNLVWNNVLALELYRTVTLQVGADLDVRALSAGTARPLPLNFGLTARLGGGSPAKDAEGKDEPFWRTSEYRPSLSFAPLARGVMDIGVGLNMPLGVNDTNPPKATFDVAAESHISPDLNGTQDQLSFKLAVSDERYLDSFTFQVKDSEGKVVRTIRNKELRPETDTFGSLWDRFVRVKQGVPVPDPLVWDGTDDTGTTLADGAYTWNIQAIDDNGNIYNSEPRTVVVDTTPPQLGLTVPADNPNRAFAPNGDRPTFRLAMSSSSEPAWTVEVLDSRGQVVKTSPYSQNLPEALEWDGTDKDGNKAPDGVYSIRMSSTDKAGNTSTAIVDKVLLISEPTPVTMRADTTWFSPNKDRIKDDVTVTISSNRNVRVESWTFELVDSKGSVVRTATGTETLPDYVQIKMEGQGETLAKALVFNIADDKGALLPEDSYTLNARVLYINGNRPSATTPALVLDLTPPSASVALGDTIFSPNGDGRKDSLPLTQTASTEPEWKASINSADGRTVRTWTWNGAIPAALEWDGLADDGTPAPNGRYTYQLSSVDLAGNSGASAPAILELDSRSAAVEANPDNLAFSPNNDNIKDKQTLRLRWSPETTIQTWKISVVPSAGAETAAPIHVAQGTGTPPAAWDWNALKGPGQAYPDGTYRALVELTWTKGDIARIFSRDFVIDTQAPRIDVQGPADGLFFSPNGDNQKDNLDIRQSSTNEIEWKGRILAANGSLVREFSWAGEAASFAWDGLDSRGRKVADGSYRYEVSSTDPAGNSGRKELEPITVNTRRIQLGLEASLKAFSPNNDTRNDTIGFTPLFAADAKDQTQPADLASWKLEIRSAGRAGSEGALVRTLSGQNAPPESIAWDGKADASRDAPEGEYRALLTVVNKAGTAVTVPSATFLLDITPPAARAWAALTTFSPDGDGRNDKVNLTMESKDEAVWEARVMPRGAAQSATTWTWNGKLPASADWDGMDTARGRALPDGTYTWMLKGTDLAGNSTETSPVDLTIDTRLPVVTLRATPPAFSPNNDSVAERITFSPTLSLREGVDSWTLEVRPVQPASAAAVRTFRQKGLPPAGIDWDGKTDAAASAPDGAYRATLTVNYLKGNQPSITSDSFALDTKAPTISLRPVTLVFSPEGDGYKDLALIDQTSSTEELWTGDILSAAGKVIRSWTWKGQTSQLRWDGLDQNGKAAPDGTYTYEVKSRDAAGNATVQRSTGLVVDRRETPVRLAASASGLVPGSTGPNATIGFQTFVDVKDGIETWTLTILNDKGSQVGLVEGKGPIPERLGWDGLVRAAAGQAPVPVADGRYEARLDAVYLKGNRPSASSGSFVVDRSGPSGTIAVSPSPFSPDDDGVEDEVTLGLDITDLSDIRDWKLEILDPEDHLFTDFAGRNAPAPRIVWNGKSRKGETVEAAMDYTARLTITDVLGNTSTITNLIPVDVLVYRSTDPETGKEILRIRLPGITFRGGDVKLDNTALKPEELTRNARTIDRLAQILRKYGSYRITVEGHANSTEFRNARAFEREQAELRELSTGRADAVMKALIQRGIAANRLNSIGVGASRPVVEFADTDNVWKNRRVEFILRK